MREVALGLLGLKVAGLSVNGTSVSPSASAGVGQSGANASRLVAANALRKVSLRVTCSDMVCAPGANRFTHESLFYLVPERLINRPDARCRDLDQMPVRIAKIEALPAHFPRALLFHGNFILRQP